LGLGDTEDVSEVRVEDIKETVGETPEEEERSDEDESPDWSSQLAVAHEPGLERW
jgi:hypothetical protein